MQQYNLKNNDGLFWCCCFGLDLGMNQVLMYSFYCLFSKTEYQILILLNYLLNLIVSKLNKYVLNEIRNYSNFAHSIITYTWFALLCRPKIKSRITAGYDMYNNNKTPHYYHTYEVYIMTSNFVEFIFRRFAEGNIFFFIQIW